MSSLISQQNGKCRFDVTNVHLFRAILSHQDEFICELEGIRVITETMVHLCSCHINKCIELGDIKGTNMLYYIATLLVGLVFVALIIKCHLESRDIF